MFCINNKQNSIAFGSAPQREADSQPISQLATPAVSQTETHSLGFLSVADRLQAVGRTNVPRASSGRMAMQPTTDLLVGGSNPGSANMAAVPPAVDRPGFEPPTQNYAVGCVTIRPGFDVTVMSLSTAWRLLSENLPPTPPSPPPSKK